MARKSCSARVENLVYGTSSSNSASRSDTWSGQILDKYRKILNKSNGNSCRNDHHGALPKNAKIEDAKIPTSLHVQKSSKTASESLQNHLKIK